MQPVTAPQLQQVWPQSNKTVKTRQHPRCLRSHHFIFWQLSRIKLDRHVFQRTKLAVAVIFSGWESHTEPLHAQRTSRVGARKPHQEWQAPFQVSSVVYCLALRRRSAAYQKRLTPLSKDASSGRWRKQHNLILM